MNPKMVTLEQIQSEGTILLGRIRDFMDSGVDTLELEISDKFDGAYVDGGYLILCKGSQKLQLGPFASGDSDLPEVTIADNGKVLKVVNGVWAKGIDATGGGGSYDDTELRGRISAIENKESGWNAKYTKPSSGIPKTDLASAVQSSLNKADNALQSVPSTYRTAAQQDIIDNGKLSDAPSDGKQYARKNGAWAEVQGGGGGAAIFEITVTEQSGSFTYSPTFAEIQAAITTGKVVVVNDNGHQYQYYWQTTNFIHFERVFEDDGYIFRRGIDIYSNGTADVDTYQLNVPMVNDAVLTIKQGGVTKGTFSANASTATEINLDAGGGGDNTLVVTAWLSEYGTPAAIIGTPSTTHAEIIDAIENEKDITLVAQIDDSANRYNFDITRSNGDYWPVVFASLIPPDDDYWGEHTAVYISVSPANVWSISYDDYAKKNDLDDKQDKALIVNITESGGTYTADKTNAEIDAAWLANKEIFAVINGDLRLQCVESLPLRAVFSADTKVSDIFNITVKIANNIVTIDEAAFQLKTITDYEGYFTEKTVEGALAEIGGTLDGLEDIVDGKLSDAPSNGKTYGRKNGAWSEVISGGGGAEVFIVTITQSGGVFSADKTNAEIYAAAQANNIVIAIITVSGSRMPLLSATSTKAVFADTMRTQDVHNGTLTIENNVVTAVDTELQSAEISDVADYFTDKTVEGALAEIGAKLAAYPSDVWEGGSYGS